MSSSSQISTGQEGRNDSIEISVKGTWISVPAIQVNGKTIICLLTERPLPGKNLVPSESPGSWVSSRCWNYPVFGGFLAEARGGAGGTGGGPSGSNSMMLPRLIQSVEMLLQ